MKIGKHPLALSHQEKIFYPESRITKGDVLAYYEKISEKILHELHQRPIAMLRCPDGIEKTCFFQKNAGDYFPKWMQTQHIPHISQKGKTNAIICSNKASLLYLANQGCVEFHRWGSIQNHLNKPDQLVFDLDPQKN